MEEFIAKIKEIIEKVLAFVNSIIAKITGKEEELEEDLPEV